MPLFDAYIFIDWSAKNCATPVRPRADAIWIGELVRHRSQSENYCRTRSECYSRLECRLLEHVRAKRRVLVGFDFPYGYPSGFCTTLGISDPTKKWSAIWEKLAAAISDNTRNRNNRFIVASALNQAAGGVSPGPFWGCPQGFVNPNLQMTSPGFPFNAGPGISLQKLRTVESRLRGTQEAWKLYGSGSVGSQALTGIPYVHKLCTHPGFKNFSRVWPFETGFTANPSIPRGAYILHAEIWPGVVNMNVNALMTANPNIIRDQAQVRAMCDWAEDRDRMNNLGPFFDAPAGLNPRQTQVCVEEEGWVLGA